MYCTDSTWESKEIKSNTTIPPIIGAAADFKYLIRIPKQELEDGSNDDSTATDGNKRWNDKYLQDSENDSDENSDEESDDEEETVILRCQTSTCQGDKCVPVEFDFVVRVRFGDEEDTPQAADTYFPYTMPCGSSKDSPNELINSVSIVNHTTNN